MIETMFISGFFTGILFIVLIFLLCRAGGGGNDEK